VEIVAIVILEIAEVVLVVIFTDHHDGSPRLNSSVERFHEREGSANDAYAAPTSATHARLGSDHALVRHEASR